MTDPKSPKELCKQLSVYFNDPENFTKNDTIPKMKPVAEELYEYYLNKPSEVKKYISDELSHLSNYFDKYTNNNNRPYKCHDFITGAIIYVFSHQYMPH